jgi:LPXTG-site transpeptidase (sortase) family protein
MEDLANLSTRSDSEGESSMNIGSDYLLVRAIRRRRFVRALSFASVFTGIFLLVISGSYFIYSQMAREDLSNLVYPATTLSLPQIPLQAAPVIEEIAIPETRFAQAYPGLVIQPKYWSDPIWAEGTSAVAVDEFRNGFQRIQQSDLAAVGTLEPVTRIEIPSIGLDAAIKELELLNLGNAYAWETPKNVVGHVPSTAHVGEAGRGYLFGHLESPLQGEGNIFRRLPEIPQFLKNGEEVYIKLSQGDGATYLYKVVSTEVVDKEDFLILPSGSKGIVSLVACVPKLVYSHRLIVNAEPVGIQTPSPD